MRVLVFHAHPDDAEMLAGGTLVLLANAGHDITIATMTPGDCGAADKPPEEIAAVRRREATQAAALVGARYLCAEFRDLAVFNDDASRRRVVEILRRTQPELVLAASPTDYMCDHETASALVRDCLFAAPAPNYLTHAPNAAAPLPHIPHLYFMDPFGGTDRDNRVVKPDFVVDVLSVFDRKQRMLAQHRSQRDWLMVQHGLDDYLAQMEDWTHQRGALASLEFGEGFRLYRGHPYPQTPLLEGLLGPQFVHLVD
jgi:LmbE family N-acetylglucosaminyl deacetylase